MDISTLFAEYYTLYRGDDETPDTTDPEWKVFLRGVNAAIARWENVDGVLWRELWSEDSSQTVAASTYSYTAPSDFKHAGGYVELRDPSSDAVVKLPVKDMAFEQISGGVFAFFTGNPSSGYSVNLSTDAIVDRTGWTIYFPYYKTATRINDSTETGTTELEMSDPYFAVHHALKNRFRASRNNTGIATADRDAELALAGMQHRNDMGTFNNQWNILDTTTGGWGV